jgi:hypothetical protein
MRTISIEAPDEGFNATLIVETTNGGTRVQSITVAARNGRGVVPADVLSALEPFHTALDLEDLEDHDPMASFGVDPDPEPNEPGGDELDPQPEPDVDPDPDPEPQPLPYDAHPTYTVPSGLRGYFKPNGVPTPELLQSAIDKVGESPTAIAKLLGNDLTAPKISNWKAWYRREGWIPGPR